MVQFKLLSYSTSESQAFLKACKPVSEYIQASAGLCEPLLMRAGVCLVNYNNCRRWYKQILPRQLPLASRVKSRQQFQQILCGKHKTRALIRLVVLWCWASQEIYKAECMDRTTYRWCADIVPFACAAIVIQVYHMFLSLLLPSVVPRHTMPSTLSLHLCRRQSCCLDQAFLRKCVLRDFLTMDCTYISLRWDTSSSLHSWLSWPRLLSNVFGCMLLSALLTVDLWWYNSGIRQCVHVSD